MMLVSQFTLSYFWKLHNKVGKIRRKSILCSSQAMYGYFSSVYHQHTANVPGLTLCKHSHFLA